MNLPDRIIELSEKATPGPWIAVGDDMVVTESRYLICEMSWPSFETEPSPEFNLIAEYRTLAPRLAEWARRAAPLLEYLSKKTYVTHQDGAQVRGEWKTPAKEARALLAELELRPDAND